MYVFWCIRMCMHIDVCVYVSMYVCMYEYMHFSADVCEYVCLCM
jgi:hypothetical protein